MGRIYTFYSPMHGQCKTTATAIAVAIAEAKKGNDVIITHVQSKMSAMEAYLGFAEQNKFGAMEDVGLNNLVYNIEGRELTERDIKAAVIKISDHLYMLPALGQSRGDTEKDAIISNLITTQLPKYYRSVFVDLGIETGEKNAIGRERPMIKTITEAAAVNYVTLAQSGWLWKKYPFPNVKYLITGYDEDSKYTTFRFRFKVGAPAIAIPDCTEYADALSDGKIKEFIERHENINIKKGKSKVEKFFKSVEGVVKHGSN